MSTSCDPSSEKRREFQTFSEKRSQLANQFTTLQKEVWGIFRLRSDVSDSRNVYTQLHAYSTGISKAYNRDAGRFRDNIDKLKHRLLLLQHRAEEIQPTTESVSRIKALMQEIESCIEAIRSVQRSEFDELQFEEQRLWQEIGSHEKRLEIWEKRKFSWKIQANFDQKTVRPCQADNEGVHVDIRRFQEFVSQEGGHTGGWDEVDHATFLKHRGRVKDGQNIGEFLVPFIPVHSSEAIAKHEQWHITYGELSQKSRDAIKEWRENKAKLKAEQNVKSQLEVDSPERDEKQEREEARRREEREEKQTQLMEWRLEKERDMAKRRVEDREQEEKRRIEMERENSMKEEVKLHVAEYVSRRREAQRQDEETRAAELEVERDKGISANQEVVKFLVRDREIADRHRERGQRVVQQELEREERLQRLKSKVRIEVNRDTERALGKTEGSRAREKASEEERGRPLSSRDGSVSAPVMKLGTHRLATPSWRQNL